MLLIVGLIVNGLGKLEPGPEPEPEPDPDPEPEPEPIEPPAPDDAYTIKSCIDK